MHLSDDTGDPIVQEVQGMPHQRDGSFKHPARDVWDH